MKRLAFLTHLLLGCALIVPGRLLVAQDSVMSNAKMAGQWDFSFTSPQGPSTWRVTFEQAVDTLRGQAATEFGTLQLSEGWITGNDLFFSVSLNFNGQSITVNFSGTVRGDTAEGSIDVPGVGVDPFPFQGVRVMAGSMSSQPFLEPRRLVLSLRPAGDAPSRNGAAPAPSPFAPPVPGRGVGRS